MFTHQHVDDARAAKSGIENNPASRFVGHSADDRAAPSGLVFLHRVPNIAGIAWLLSASLRNLAFTCTLPAAMVFNYV